MGFSGASSKPHGSLYFLVLLLMNGGPGVEWVPRGSLQIGQQHPNPWRQRGLCFGTALLSMRGTWGAGRLNPSLPSSHQLPNSGGSPRNGALPRKSLLGELLLLPLLCVWQEGPGLRFLLRPFLDICLGRSQVGAWAACCSQAPALHGAVMRWTPGTFSCPCLISNTVFLLCGFPSVSAELCLPPGLSQPFCPHLLPITQEFPKHSDLADSTILWFVMVVWLIFSAVLDFKTSFLLYV